MMLSTVTGVGVSARYGTTPSPSGESAGVPSEALIPMAWKS
jgi:hypothetical protein